MNLLSLNHIAYQTRDVAATHEFYTSVLGLDLIGAVRMPSMRIESVGADAPAYLHVFYGLADTSAIAFFELDEPFHEPQDELPVWTRHLALNVETRQELEDWDARLTAAGVEHSKEIDHEHIWYSIYLTDPNGVRVEITHQVRPLVAEDAVEAKESLRSWLEDKENGVLKGLAGLSV